MNGWAAYYADGTRYTSASRSWVDLPPTGMIGAVEFNTPPYRRVVTGGDWYWLEDEIRASETVWGDYVSPPTISRRRLKQGAAVSDDRFDAFCTRMMEDRTWP